MGQVSHRATNAIRWICGTLMAIAWIACGPKMTNDPIPKENQNVTTPSNQPALDAELEAELAQIRRAPAAAVGMGEKAYSPYELVEGEALDQRNDRVFRFVMLRSSRTNAAVTTCSMQHASSQHLRTAEM
jgi:hypothetical protein